MSDLKLADGVSLTDDDVAYAASEELRWLNRGRNSDLETNWEAAYSYYKNEPRAQDEEGRSKLQTSDVADSIEWLLPPIVKAFVESPDVVRFDAVSQEDEAQALLETQYVHRAFMKQCGGFQVLYETIKDALLLKVGVTNCYHDESITSRPETYTELTEGELAKLLYPANGTEVKEVSRETREIPATDPNTGTPLIDPNTGQPVMVPVFDVDIRRYTTRGRPAVEVCVPEQFRVRMDHDSIDLSKARFCAYWSEKSAAKLVALGYDPEKVDGIQEISRTDTNRGAMVRQAREDVENTFNYPASSQAQAHVDRSQRMVTLNRCFMTLDINGDGIEEYVVVVLGGDDGEVLLDWYEVDENPFDALTPFIAPHKFYGYSVFDKIREIQDAATKFLRMVSDNIDLMNNPRQKYVPGQVNMEDVMIRRVGGHQRVEEMSAYEEMMPLPVGAPAFQMIDYFEKKRGERVGIDPNAQSIANSFPDESMNTAFERLMSAKEEVVGLIVRVAAEVWFTPLMVKLRKIIMTHQNRAETVRLGSKWVEMDPRNWTDRTDTTAKVGLGTGDRIKKITGLRELIGMQGQMVQAGKEGYLVTDSKVHAAVSDFVRYAGLGDPDDFFLDPIKTNAEIQQAMQTQQPPSPEAMEAYAARQKQAQAAEAAAQQGQQGVAGPDPQVLLQIEQIKAESKAQSDQMKLQSDQMKLQSDQIQFMLTERREWATLAAESQEKAASLAIEADEAQATGGGA